jgi:hypothetical protein
MKRGGGCDSASSTVSQLRLHQPTCVVAGLPHAVQAWTITVIIAEVAFWCNPTHYAQPNVCRLPKDYFYWQAVMQVVN